MKTSAKGNSFPSLSLLGVLFLFGILWCSDFPKPIYDDLFYLGASVNLARGGDLANPLLARQEFPSHFFFVYPPLHSYAVAGWLKLFGISADSVTAFPLLMQCVIAAATIAILRKHGAPCWLEWLVPLGVAVAFLPSGLRPEPVAVALAMAGFALLECGGARALFNFPGFLLLFLGASASPRIAPFAAALALLAACRLWVASRTAAAGRWNFLVAALAAMSLAGLSFLAMIGFRLREFLMMFRLHAGRVSEGKLGMIQHFLKEQRVTVWPLWAVFFLLLLAALRRPKNALAQSGLLVACMLPVEAVIADLVQHIVWFMILPVFLLAAACLQGASRRLTAIFAVSLLLIFTLANVKTFVNVVGVQTGRISPDLGEQRAQALALRPAPDHPILTDPSAARYLYGYQFPPGCLDLGFCAPFPGGFVTTTGLRPGDIYVVTLAALRGLERDTYVPHPPEPEWNPVGLSLLTFDRYPRRIFIIPEESCVGLRPGVLKP